MLPTHRDTVLILGHLLLDPQDAIATEDGVLDPILAAGAGAGAQEGTGSTTTADTALGLLGLMVITIDTTVIKREETTAQLAIANDRAVREG